MLLSEKAERSRRFTLALRAGLPVLILIFLLFTTTLSTEDISFGLKEVILLASLTFIAIYFIYFLMNLSIQETMLDRTTGSFNRRTFIHSLKEYKPKSIVCLSIGNLSPLSEHYSIHQVDTLLYEISKNIHNVFSAIGIRDILIGRNRGSEFLIALNCEPANIHTILENFTSTYKTINSIDVDYSFAIVKNTPNNFEKTIEQLRDIIASQVTHNDYSKKREIQDAKELSSVEQNVVNSIKKKKLNFSFRPLLNIHTDTIDTYEISVKLTQAKKDILPRTFLPIVNRLGLGREYDYTLSTHIMDLSLLVQNNISFTFNLSPFSLRDKEFQKKFFRALETKKVEPSRLIIQLYERKTHHDLSAHLQTLKKFRSYGIRICIDNFGSSNASMEYIKHFKFDMVQFDRDYVTKLDDNTTYAMLSSLVKMSKDLQVQTVAKWVDNEPQKKSLKTLGVDYIQGFGVSKPMNEDELINKYN